MVKNLRLSELIQHIQHAVTNKIAFSFIRIGDGELTILAQDTLLSFEEIEKNYGWIKDSYNYCGTKMPNLELRDRMIEAVKGADIVGVFDLHHHKYIENPAVPEIAKFNASVFEKLEFYPSLICYAFENIYMPMKKQFVDLIKRNPPLLVGKPSHNFAQFLKERIDVDVVGAIELNGYEDIFNCYEKIKECEFDWVLISGGANAGILCDMVKTKLGKCAVDFGHSPDYILKPNEYVTFKDKYKHFVR
jgi:hypothetical protein